MDDGCRMQKGDAVHDRSRTIADLIGLLEDGDLVLRRGGTVHLWKAKDIAITGRKVECMVEKVGSGRCGDGGRKKD